MGVPTFMLLLDETYMYMYIIQGGDGSLGIVSQYAHQNNTVHVSHMSSSQSLSH